MLTETLAEIPTELVVDLSNSNHVTVIVVLALIIWFGVLHPDKVKALFAGLGDKADDLVDTASDTINQYREPTPRPHRESRDVQKVLWEASRKLTRAFQQTKNLEGIELMSEVHKQLNASIYAAAHPSEAKIPSPPDAGTTTAEQADASPSDGGGQ